MRRSNPDKYALFDGYKWSRRAAACVPKRPRTRRRTTPEGALLRTILDGLAAHRIPRWRIGVGAFKVGERYVKMGDAGLPDIVALVPGAGVLFIEVKSPAGRLTAEQRAFQGACGGAGVAHILARSWKDVSDVLSWFMTRGAA